RSWRTSLAATRARNLPQAFGARKKVKLDPTPVGNAFAPDLRRLNSEPEPDRALLPVQRNWPMPGRPAPSAPLPIADSLSQGRSAPSRPPSFAPSCREIRQIGRAHV